MATRKVIFNTGLPDSKGNHCYVMHAPDESKQKQGILHSFGIRTFYEEKEHAHFSQTVAIVEDIETGQVHIVPPENIIFQDTLKTENNK